MNTSEAIVQHLEALGVERVFGYPGGRVVEIFDLLPESDVDVVRSRDEREASVMAEAHGRITGEPAVLAGQSPWIGFLGAIGQMEARLGSSPMLVLTEASERGDYSTVAPYQQSRGDYGGLDLPVILGGVTKEHWFPRNASETVRSLHLAYKHAVAGRPGPTAVILDGNAVTADVPDAQVPPLWDPVEQTRTWTSSPTDKDVATAADALADANRPVVVAGNGVHAARAYEELRRFAVVLYDMWLVVDLLMQVSLNIDQRLKPRVPARTFLNIVRKEVPVT